MTAPGTGVTTLQPRLPAEWFHFARLLDAAAATTPGWRPPASNWLEAYRVRRCPCGGAAQPGRRCYLCGSTIL